MSRPPRGQPLFGLPNCFDNPWQRIGGLTAQFVLIDAQLGCQRHFDAAAQGAQVRCIVFVVGVDLEIQNILKLLQRFAGQGAQGLGVLG